MQYNSDKISIIVKILISSEYNHYSKVINRINELDKADKNSIKD